MDSSSTTIDGIDLLALPGALQWHEAVAVVVQLADTIRHAGVTSVPDLPHIQLSSDGTIAILPGSTESDQPVKQLAETLKLLLQGAAAPQELVQVIGRAIEGAPDQKVDDFARSLHYFERPARHLVLQAAVERIAPAASDARIKRVVEGLRAKVVDAEAAPRAPAKAEPAEQRRRRNMTIAALLVLAILVGGGAGAWWQFRPQLTNAGGGVRSAATRAGHGIAQAFNGGVQLLFGDQTQKQASDVPQPARPEHAVTARPKQSNAGPRLKEVTPTTTGGQDLATVRPARIPELWQFTLPSSVDRIDEVVVITTQPERFVMAPDIDGGRIYSQQDAGVTPPVAVQPLLGHITTDATAIPGDMELIIDAKGAVERVTVLSPNRYQDRWLIYAIKARRFAPATADGHPVRYRLRLRTGM